MNPIIIARTAEIVRVNNTIFYLGKGGIYRFWFCWSLLSIRPYAKNLLAM